MSNDDRPYRVLALDGGGIRGLYTATVLESFARHFSSVRGVGVLDVGKGFDLIVGTSTGGIVACGLAFGLTPAAIISLFRRFGPVLFRRPIPDSPLRFLKWAVGSLRRSANSDQQLRLALEREFGDTTLEQLFNNRQIAICIPAVNITTGRSVVFKTPHTKELTRDKRFRLVDVCLATSAAPIYLPLAVVDDPDDNLHELVLADGGLWANNPVLIGLIEALRLARKEQPIHVLSVSTCPTPQGEIVSSLTRDWGLVKWKAGTTALTIALESQSWGHHYMALRLAEVLRDHGRACHVIRVNHSQPSVAQARCIGLDRASASALRILGELGRMDGDVDLAGSHWGSSEVSAMVAQMFSTMPPVPSSRGHGGPDRRAAPREQYEQDLGAGLVLKDRSPAGACLMIRGLPPEPGSIFRCALEDKLLTGTVRWVQEGRDGVACFGIETTAFK